MLVSQSPATYHRLWVLFAISGIWEGAEQRFQEDRNGRGAVQGTYQLRVSVESSLPLGRKARSCKVLC